MTTTISPSLVPTVPPGSLFSRFTSDTSIGIRFFEAADPVYFDTLNRPVADLSLRQLILAKTLDAINLRLSHQSLFPWLIQPTITSGTASVNLPLSWIWDMHVSLPKKWEKIRLAKIKRVSGENGTTGEDFTGKLRLVFTGQEIGSVTEVALFQADFIIDSVLDFQIVEIDIPATGEEPIVVSSGERETIAGFLIFRTLDATDEDVQSFYDFVAPPITTTDADSDGEFDTPAIYEIDDSEPGGESVSGDFSTVALSHGTGLLVLSATNSIPALDSDPDTWLSAFNYPFGEAATLTSASPSGITIPTGLFKEFMIIAPSNDQPTDDISGDFNPVWINRISREDASSDTLKFFFATFNVTSDQASTVPIEFASLTLERGFTEDQIVAIESIDDLLLASGETASEEQNQGFGRGHVVLSSLWGGTTTTIDEFFDEFATILDEPPDAVFVKESTRLSAFAISRVPRFTPTSGQAEALKGSRADTDRPNVTNRYVVEADQGLGDKIDFGTSLLLDEDKRENPDIDRFGWTGSLAHRIVHLVVDTSGDEHTYEEDILPRLRILLGRDVIFGDFWWDGSRLKFFNGDSWIG